MYPFRYTRAPDVAGAIAAAAQEPRGAYLAGGTDMMQLVKDEVLQPRRLIDLGDIETLRRIEVGPQGLRLGALAPMADVADHPEVRKHYPVIAQALLASASPQVRNMGTMGGNLLQRTRCLYFRDVASPCNKRDPGSGCGAIGGVNRMNAILGGSPQCVATHASDLAVALIALDAVVIAQGASGERRLPLRAFHRLPGDTPWRENELAPGELITAVEVPAGAVAQRSLYRKLRDRASFEFALVAAAVGLDIANGTIRQARIALGGVGTKPWRAPAAEAALVGAAPTKAAFVHAASLALAGAQPLEHNGFKVQLAQRNLVRALTMIGA